MLIGREVGLCEAPYQIIIPPNPPGVTTEKTGDAIRENGEDINYKITVTYDPSAPRSNIPDGFRQLTL